MPFVTVGKENSGDIDLYYEDHGSGQPVVLIHGFPLNSASWEEKQTPVLLDAGYRVIAYDRRGFGNSSQPTTGYNYTTFTEDLHLLITRLGLREIVLVGFSMGGGEVARYIGSHGTSRIAKAVFVSAVTPYLLRAPDNPDGVDSVVFEGIQREITADRPAFLTQFFKNFYNLETFGGNRISDEAVRLSWNVAARASSKGTYDCVSSWLTDFRQDLARIDIPPLVVHGDADRTCPIGITGKKTSELVRGSRLVTVKGALHGLHWTHAEELNQALLEFLGTSKEKRETTRTGDRAEPSIGREAHLPAPLMR